MSTELAINGVNDLEIIGKLFERSGMFGCTQEGQGMVLAMHCHMSGMTPIEFNNRFHLIKGRQSMRADAMLAGVHGLGGSHQVVERTADAAEIKITYKKTTHTERLTWEEAKLEPFVYKKDGKTLKENYATPRSRKQMLWARVVSDCVRAVAPEVVQGVYTPEEISDIPEHGFQAAKPVEAKVVAMSTKPEEATETIAEVNCDAMPIGKMAGTPWSEMDGKLLEKIIVSDNAKLRAALTKGHVKAITAEINKRKEELEAVNDDVPFDEPTEKPEKATKPKAKRAKKGNKNAE